MGKFWTCIYAGIGVSAAAIIALALYGASQNAPSSTVIQTPAAASPAAPVDSPRRPKFNVN